MSIIEGAPPEVVVEPEVEVITTEEEARRDTLLRAAEKVERHWMPGDLQHYDMFKNEYSYCVIGAVVAAHFQTDDIWENWEDGGPDYYDLGGEIMRVNHTVAYGWNDHIHLDPRDAGEMVAKALRHMANGKTFEEARELVDPTWRERQPGQTQPW